MDYRKLLGKTETLVLPYFGGPNVDARDRRLRVAGEAAAGWHRFEVRGRTARALGPAEAEGLDDLPSVRGHLVAGWLISGGAPFERVRLLPEDEPPSLAPCRARRWPSGDVVFEAIDFEGEAEEEVRRAVEEGRGIEHLKGVSAALRAAYGLALLLAAARVRRVPVSPLEARAHVLEVAGGGPAAAAAVLDRLGHLRREDALREAARAAAQRRPAPATHDPVARAEDALTKAGARFFDARRLGGDQLEVRYEVLGERFVSVVDAATLQVVSAGICLDGFDREVTLDSLPSVIREAIENGELAITRYWQG